MNTLLDPSTDALPAEHRAGGALYRLAAFAERDGGGNPAGVWVGDDLPDAATMRQIAADVGYSETAFVAPAEGRQRTVRYYSSLAEVSFCGHATIAAGVVLASRAATASGDAHRFVLETRAGTVELDAMQREGRPYAALTSVLPRHEAASPALVEAALALLGWRSDQLDPRIPPVRAYGGAWHLVLAAITHDRLAHLQYDMPALTQLMEREGLTTLQLVWRESPTRWHARNPFPVGGVFEDPATGAAAAAFGGYLRDAGLVAAPAAFTILQGEAMGRPSVLEVDVPANGGIIVRGSAVPIRG